MELGSGRMSSQDMHIADSFAKMLQVLKLKVQPQAPRKPKP